MKLVVAAGFCLVASFAIAIGCQHANNFPASTGAPASPQPVAAIGPDGGIVAIPDGAGPMGGGNSPGFPGTNQP